MKLQIEMFIEFAAGLLLIGYFEINLYFVSLLALQTMTATDSNHRTDYLLYFTTKPLQKVIPAFEAQEVLLCY